MSLPTPEEVEETVRQIRAVEIQGATAVAEAGVDLVRRLEAAGAAADRIEDVAQRLQAARPTEPLLENGLRIGRATGDYAAVLEHIRSGQDAIADNTAEVLDSVETVYTHCHSSTVVAAVTAGDLSGARVTETRPLYQGRTTARELADAGLDVELFVDGGARLALADADAMLIGADELLPDGTVINKVGSGMVAAAAARMDVPVYVCADSWKLGVHDDRENLLERRDPDEVWDNAPQGVEPVNFAFEAVDPDDLEGVVSELGVHTPSELKNVAREAYPALFEA